MPYIQQAINWTNKEYMRRNASLPSIKKVSDHDIFETWN